ncbi:hypothetical protein [Pontimicrobium sp. MEBiC01747]
MAKKYTASDIQALSAGEHIRMRPKMYFEKCFEENSLNALSFEVLCHAFDEYFDGKCNDIKITFWSHAFKVRYNVGVPLRTIKYENYTYAEMIMTRIAACSNLKKHLAVGREFCNLGMATINFAAESCGLTTVWENQKGTFLFENGETKTSVIEPFENNDSWTEITVKPNLALFENLSFTSKGMQDRTKIITEKLVDLNIIIEDKIE